MMPHDVTQADLAALNAAYASKWGEQPNAETYTTDHWLAQAFAAHRSAAIAEERARVGKLLETICETDSSDQVDSRYYCLADDLLQNLPGDHTHRPNCNPASSVLP